MHFVQRSWLKKILTNLDVQLEIPFVGLRWYSHLRFINIMIHLPVHLAEEAKVGGLVCYRWMYSVDRYLRTVKDYVRNKVHPEGSIAKGYIVEECLTFCSKFLDVVTKLNRVDRHENTAGGSFTAVLS